MRALARNTAALLGSQMVGLVAPLIAIPYLARVLRPEGWAPVLAAQALAAWLIVFLEYGFDLSGTRAVARARETPAALAEIVRGVQSAKLLLVPAAALIVFAVFSVVPVLQAHRQLLPWTLAFAAARGLNPFWYFQGVERVRGAAAIEAATKALGVAGVFVVVHDASDAWRVLALQGAFAAVSLVVLTAAMAREIPLLAPAPRAGLTALRGSWVVFATRTAGGIYTQAGVVVMGFVSSTQSVVAFGGAERIVRAATGLLQPLTQVFLPRVTFVRATNPMAARQLIDRCLIWVGLFGVAIGTGALIGAPLLVRLLLGVGYEEAIPPLRALGALPPIIAVNTVLALFWALPFGHERAVLRAIVVAAAVNISLIWLLVPKWGSLGMCVAAVAAEVVVTLALGTLFLRHRKTR